MDQELHKRILELQDASYFRVLEDGVGHIVNSPHLAAPVASAFERLSRFADDIVEVGRLGVHEVHHVCCGVDITCDDLDVLDRTAVWKREGAITVRRMAGGRC